MHTQTLKRFEIPETWLAGVLFAFKLTVVLLTVLLVNWHAGLPVVVSHTLGYPDANWWANYDFFMVAFGMRSFFFLAAAVLGLGGLIQWFKYSRRAAIWSFGFGAAALIIGFLLKICVGFPQLGFDKLAI